MKVLTDKKVCYIIEQNSITECYKIDDGIYAPTHAIIKYDGKVYDDRDDALYFNFLDKIKKGKKVSNYKTSKYYGMYIERLERENPEYLI